MDLIAKLFPQYALKRELAKVRIESLRRVYDAGQTSDFYRVPPGGHNSPNQDMQIAGVRMRMRARYFDENLDLVVGIFDTLVNNVVGNSNPIRPLVRNKDGTLNDLVNKRLLRDWATFSKAPTLCGEYSMLQALKIAARAWLRDGEFLTRFARGGRGIHNTEIPLSLELIEADYLPFDKSDLIEKTTNSKIVQGVELNKYSKPIAYHLFDEHPGNDLTGGLKLKTHRVKASDIIHLKFTRRAHQVRGVTILHSVMNRLDDLKDYEESERIAARVAAAMTGYIEKNGEGLTELQTGDAGRTFEMSPGLIFDNLLPGEKVGTIASNRPNPELINFRTSMLRAISAGVGANHSTVSKDYNGTFSAQRQELLEAKPSYAGLRQLFVDSYLFPIWREFVKIEIASSRIATEGTDPETLFDIEPRSLDIGWIDPKKQAEATVLSINAGLTTRGQVIREQGGDPQAVYSEIEEEEKIFGPLPIGESENKNTGETDGQSAEQDQE